MSLCVGTLFSTDLRQCQILGLYQKTGCQISPLGRYGFKSSIGMFVISDICSEFIPMAFKLLMIC